MKRGWVAVISTTKAKAWVLIDELGLDGDVAIPVSSRQGSDALEGMRVSTILIDEGALPLPNDVQQVLYGNLLKTCGHGGMYSIRRIGP